MGFESGFFPKFSPEKKSPAENEAGQVEADIKDAENLIERQSKLIDSIVLAIRDMTPEDKMKVMRRLFEHSVEDGLRVAEEVKLTPRELASCVVQHPFFLKHSAFANELFEKLHKIPEKKRYAAEHANEVHDRLDNWLEDYPSDYFFDSYEFYQDRQGKVGELIRQMDTVYAEYLRGRKFKPEDIRDWRSLGVKAAEENLLKAQRALKKEYYRGSIFDEVMRHARVRDQAGLREAADIVYHDDDFLQEKYKSTDDFLAAVLAKHDDSGSVVWQYIHQQEPVDLANAPDLPSDTVDQSFVATLQEHFGMDPKRLEKARYRPINAAFRVENMLAKERLQSELNAGLANRGLKIVFDRTADEYRVEEIEGENNTETEDPLEKYDNMVMDEFERIVEKCTGENKEDVVLMSPLYMIAKSMAGMDSERAWKLRRKLLQLLPDEHMTNAVLEGLAGCDSDQAWTLRFEENLKNVVSQPLYKSLAGLDTHLAWESRRAFTKVSGKVSRDKYVESIAIAGLESDEAKKFRAEHLSNSYLIYSFLGSDSQEAWDLRERLIAKGDGFDIVSVATSLIAIDTPRAWEMRERLVAEYGVAAVLTEVLTSLAGLDSRRAEVMRDQILAKLDIADLDGTNACCIAGVDSPSAKKTRDILRSQGREVALVASLGTTYESLVWRLKYQEKKKIKIEKKENFLEKFEAKSLDYIQSLLDKGADPSSVAQGLAGLDSERAWQMRQELLEKGANPNSVAQGLAGLDSERAWKMRQELLEKGAAHGWVAQGLAGLDSERAWQMRQNILDKGAGLSSVAQGLAGLDSERAWKMRQELLEKGADPSSVALGLAGLDSERAWKMRQELLEKGAAHGWVAQGLAGLDSERAWQMRQELLEKGANLRYVAHGLAGLDSERAWKMRQELLDKGEDPSTVALGLAGYYTTFVWRLKYQESERSDQLTPEEYRKLELLNLVNSPEAEAIAEYFRQDSKLKGKSDESWYEHAVSALERSPSVALQLTDMIKKAPAGFLDLMAAKQDRATAVLAERFIRQAWPQLLERDRPLRGFAGYFGFGESGFSDSHEPSPESYLSPHSGEALDGGDPKSEKEVELMELREASDQLLVTGVYGRYNQTSSRWEKVQFPVFNAVMEPVVSNTITLTRVSGLQEVSLPKPLDARLVKERVKGIDAGQTEIALDTRVSPLDEAVADVKSPVQKIVYSIEQSRQPQGLDDIKNEQYQRFRKAFERQHKSEMADSICPLPEELDLFLVSIKNKPPKEQVMAIEKFVRDISHYDFDNKEVTGLKSGKDAQSRLYLMSQRVAELQHIDSDKKAELAGKRFAGVCADFALLTSAMLRRAGFLSGVVTGFQPQGKKVTTADSHSTAFVVWPDKSGKNKIIVVDGTPEGVPGISRPSLVEQEETRQEKMAEIKKEMDERFEEVRAILDSTDPEAIKELTNGELERYVNYTLQYDAKMSNLQVVKRVLESYWYSPAKDMSPDGLRRYFSEEIKAEQKDLEKKPELVDQPAGKYLFEAIENFVGRFMKAGRTRSVSESLDLLQNIFDAVSSDLSQSERRSVNAIVTYLKAKKISS